MENTVEDGGTPVPGGRGDDSGASSGPDSTTARAASHPPLTPSPSQQHLLLSRFLKHRPTKVCVFGSGSFGTAMGTHLALQGHEVWLLTRKPDVVEKITREHKHPELFRDMSLPYNVTATTDARDALLHADYILHAIPVQSSFEYLSILAPLIRPDVPFINTSKGLHTQRLALMSDVVNAALGRVQPLCCLSGPTFAEEIMKGWPTGAVSASVDPELATAVANLFMSHTFRVFTSQDVIGVEVAGALKNVYAIAAGALEVSEPQDELQRGQAISCMLLSAAVLVCELGRRMFSLRLIIFLSFSLAFLSQGLGLGVNTTALLVTRAVAEMNKLARVLGASDSTLNGLSGVGDLM